MWRLRLRLGVSLGDLWPGDPVRCKEMHEFGFRRLEAKGTQCNAQFVIVQVAIAVEVEEGELW